MAKPPLHAEGTQVTAEVADAVWQPLAALLVHAAEGDAPLRRGPGPALAAVCKRM